MSVDDLQRLWRFVERVDEVKSTRFLRDFRGTELNIRFDHMKGLGIGITDVPEEDLRSFLVTFRQFFMQREPVFLGRVYSICGRHLTDEGLRAELKRSQAAWKVALKQSAMEMNHNGKDMTPEHIGDLLINGHYFHTDEKKRRELESLMPMGKVLSRYIFLDLITDVTRQVLFLHDLITVGFRRAAFSPTPVR